MELLSVLAIGLLVVYLIRSESNATKAKTALREARFEAEEARLKAEEALGKAEEAMRDAEAALNIIQGVAPATSVVPTPALPGNDAGRGSQVSDPRPKRDERNAQVPDVLEVSLPNREQISYSGSRAFTLWVREREQLALRWTQSAQADQDAALDVAEGILLTEETDEKAIPVKKAIPGRDSQEPLPSTPLKSALKPAASAAVRGQREAVKPASESIEMQLGTYWFVRIGVMLLLTGAGILAFYKRDFFFDLPPAVKVSGFYLLSGLLGGIGFWLQHTRESLRNYGQVLVAGGFSGVYFTTYAAHIFDPVKVISDPTVVLMLLLAWGGFMAWVANRLRSETVALFAVGASYYATYVPLIHIDSGGVSHWVILASNVILAVIAVAFMLRNRWVKMPLLSMSAAYAGFALWRIRVEDPAPLAIVLLFAASLWIIYSAAVFLSRHDAFNDHKRAAFLTANNAALFGLLTWDVLRDHPQQFWILPLSFGILLLGGALAARRVIGDQVLSCKSLLTQGLTLVTLGLMTTQLSESIKGPILAAETVVLLFMAIRRDNRILKFAAIAVAAIACGFGIYDIDVNSADYLKGCLAIASFLLFAGWLSHHRLEKGNEAILRPIVSYFTCLALAVGQLALLSSGSGGDMLPVILIGATLLLTASIYLLRVREFVLIGQTPALLGLGYCLIDTAPGETLSMPLLLIMIATLALIHWWRWQRDHVTVGLINRDAVRPVLLWAEGVFSAGLIIQLLKWLCFGRELQQQWLWLGPLLALSLIGYGALTRAPFLAVLGQVFLWIGCLFSLDLFSGNVGDGQMLILPALAPIAGLILSARAASIALTRLALAPEWVVKATHWCQLVCRWAAAGLGILWIHHSVPDAYKVMVAFAVAAILLFACFRSGKAPKTQLLYYALAYAVAAGGFLIAQFMQGEAYWQSLVVIASVIILQLWIRIGHEQFELSAPVHKISIVCGGVALFFWVTARVLGIESLVHEEAVLTLSWSGIGLLFFVLGLVFKERWHALVGFVILGISLLSMIEQLADDPASWQSLVAIAIVLGVQRMARIGDGRLPVEGWIHKVFIVAGGAALFFWVTNWISNIGGEGIEGLRSISWSGVGLLFFIAGLTFRERWYRLMGLTVLGITLLSLVPIIWGFSTEWKIASFFVLGLVFVGLGFVYNRFREKINKLL